VRNGPYILVVAPEGYPGKRYRGRYCYEHQLVYWQNTGVIPGPGELIHHKNDNKHDNDFGNLELKVVGKHTADHNLGRPKKMVRLQCPGCGKIFERSRRLTHLASTTRKFTSCSRACIGKATRSGALTPEQYVNNVIEEFTIIAP
jgi:hypothetical protein